MIRTYTESTLGKSEVFQSIDTSSTPTQQERAKTLIKSAQILKNEDIEGAYVQVKQITDSLTRLALKAFDSQQVQLVYNNTANQPMSQGIPFLTFNTPRGYVTYVFVNKYLSVSRDGVYTMQSAVLRDLLIAGTISRGIKEHYQRMASNQALEKLLMNIYTEMFFRILNRLYSIAADKQLSEKTKYFINKFFLLYVFGTYENPDNVEILSRSHMKDGVLDDLALQEIRQQYDSAPPQKLSELLEIIKKLSPRMNPLANGVFLVEWINYYYTAALLAIDNIEYLIFAALTLLSGNNIVNIAASDIVKETKGIKALRSELLKIIQ